jgi:hypothetical protein
MPDRALARALPHHGRTAADAASDALRRLARDRGLLTEYRVADAGRYATCEFTGIRTSDNIYVVHSRVVNPDTSKCIPVDERERYDLKSDPFELNTCASAVARPIVLLTPSSSTYSGG